MILSGRIRTPLVCLFLAVLTAGVFMPVLHCQFLTYDDPQYVTDNNYVKAGLTCDGFRWAMTTFHYANWHPLTWLSHMLDIELFGLDPEGHHLTNLLFHIANTVLLYLALRMMTGNEWRSFAVALLFAVHPLHVESVAWVAERKDVLSTFFWMPTLLAYVHYCRTRTGYRYMAVVLSFVLGLLAKPMLVTLPLILLLLDYWPLHRIARPGAAKSSFVQPLRHVIFEKLPLLLLSVSVAAITLIAQSRGGTVSALDNSSLYENFANAATACFRYIAKMSGRLIWRSFTLSGAISRRGTLPLPRYCLLRLLSSS